MNTRKRLDDRCPDCGATLLQVVGGGMVCSSQTCCYEKITKCVEKDVNQFL